MLRTDIHTNSEFCQTAVNACHFDIIFIILYDHQHVCSSGLERQAQSEHAKRATNTKSLAGKRAQAEDQEFSKSNCVAKACLGSEVVKALALHALGPGFEPGIFFQQVRLFRFPFNWQQKDGEQKNEEENSKKYKEKNQTEQEEKKTNFPPRCSVCVSESNCKTALQMRFYITAFLSLTVRS